MACMASSDALGNFENLTGSAFNATLTGGGIANVIELTPEILRIAADFANQYPS